MFITKERFISKTYLFSYNISGRPENKSCLISSFALPDGFDESSNKRVMITYLQISWGDVGGRCLVIIIIRILIGDQSLS